MKIIKKIAEYFLIFIMFLLVFNLVTIYLIKTKHFSEVSNMRITVGNYYEWGTGGRGASEARYFFVSNNQRHKSATSFATFKDASPILGRNYIVVYNAKSPKRSGSTMFLNLPVHDSMSHYFRRGSINKIPIEAYQRTIDSFYLSNLTTGFGKFFPPYYKNEDFPELEYLWKE